MFSEPARCPLIRLAIALACALLGVAAMVLVGIMAKAQFAVIFGERFTRAMAA